MYDDPELGNVEPRGCAAIVGGAVIVLFLLLAVLADAIEGCRDKLRRRG